MSNRFSFIFSVDDVAEKLTDRYKAEIKKTIYTFNPTKDNAKAIRAAASWLADDSRKPGLLLYGPNPGTGKTTLARTLHDVMAHPELLFDDGPLNQRYQAYREKFWEYAQDDPDAISGREREQFEREHPDEAAELRRLMDEYANLHGQICSARNAIKKTGLFLSAQEIADATERDGHQYLESIRDEPLLFIDDMGVEPTEVNNFGTRILPLVELILYRYEHRLPVVVTSNLSDVGISEKYGPRIMDRLNEMCDKIAFKGVSFRM